MPAEFWTLTLREFFIKHEAFKRAEDRAKSLVYLLAGMIGQFKENDLQRVRNNAMALRRYALKRWLLDGESDGPD